MAKAQIADSHYWGAAGRQIPIAVPPHFATLVSQPDHSSVQSIRKDSAIMNHRFHLRKIAFALAVLLTATTGFGRELHFMSKLKKGENVTISAIGTSLTAADCSSWVAKLGTWLNATYPKQVTMDDEGISGSASSHTSWYASDVSGIGVQLPAALKHSPDAVFIEFAINDCSTDVGISLALSKQNLQTMIDTIHSWAATNNKTVDVVIQTMSNDPLSGLRPNLAAYEQGHREVAAANNLLLIDHFSDVDEAVRRAIRQRG